MIKPLTGLRVVDLADEHGEMCGRMLSDLGAKVIRVEPLGGANSRRIGPFASDGETSLYFALRNVGKSSLALNLETSAGKARLHEELGHADVVLLHGSPKKLAGRGLSPEGLASLYPLLVITVMSDFGQSGPYREFASNPLVGFAMGGMMHRCGRPERPPVCIPGALATDNVGVMAAFATLMATWQRRSTHRGQVVDVSAFESLAALSDWSIPNYSLNATAGGRQGAGIYSLYRCKNGWVRMIILVAHHWRALLDWMGNPAELSDPSLNDFVPRLIAHAKIEKVIEGFFAGRDMVEVALEAQSRGLPATPLFRPDQVLDNPHTRARQTFRDVDVAEGVRVRLPAGFLTADEQRLHGENRVPRIGESLDEEPDAGSQGDAFGPWPNRIERVAVATRPFEGLKVLDMGVGAVGVEVGRFLAEYGADVIKVETRHAPDFIRTIMGTEMNPNFASSSRSKRGFGINLKEPQGLALLKRMLAKADVLIENNGGGVMDRLGLGWKDVSRLNPRMVMFSSQMVGQFGPWGSWIGYGPSTHPVSGLQYLWNYPEDAENPAGSTNVHPDHFVGRIGAFAVVAGLLQRERTGKGVHLDAAQFESGIEMIGDLMAKESEEPGSVAPTGNTSLLGSPWGCFPCAGEDEWCVITVRDETQWNALRQKLGDPEWSRAEALQSREGRDADRATIEDGLAAWTRTRSPHDVMRTLQEAGVPAAVVMHGGHLIADPHLTERGFLRKVVQPNLGEIIVEGEAFHGSDFGVSVVTPAPGLGGTYQGNREGRVGLRR